LGVPDDHTTERAQGEYRCCRSRDCSAGVRHCDIRPYPRGGPCFRRFRLRFSYRFSRVLLPALPLSLLPAATTALLLPAAPRFSTPGLVSTIHHVSARGWLWAFGIVGGTANHLHAAAGMDQRTRSILPRVQMDPERRSERHRKIRDRLSRRRRPVAHRQLTRRTMNTPERTALE